VLNGHKTNKNQNKRGAICHGIQEVSGSIPLISTIGTQKDRSFHFGLFLFFVNIDTEEPFSVK